MTRNICFSVCASVSTGGTVGKAAIGVQITSGAGILTQAGDSVFLPIIPSRASRASPPFMSFDILPALWPDGAPAFMVSSLESIVLYCDSGIRLGTLAEHGEYRRNSERSGRELSREYFKDPPKFSPFERHFLFVCQMLRRLSLVVFSNEWSRGSTDWLQTSSCVESCPSGDSMEHDVAFELCPCLQLFVHAV